MTLRCLLNLWRFIRLVYRVIDDMLVIAVVAVGKAVNVATFVISPVSG